MSIVDKYKNLLNVDDRASQGEVSTPVSLVNEMLDKLPEEVFKSSTSTFLDPSFGSGTFLIEIVKRLRKQGHSMENIQERVYGTEISHRLYNKVTKLFSNYNFHKLYKEDFLTKDFNNMKFDVITGNPPYQETESKEKRAGTPIWHKFVLKSYDLLKEEGYLNMIHPNGWRNKRAKFKKVLELFNSANPLFINLSNYATGLKLFNVGTTCDWYVLQKSPNKSNTVVRDVNGIESTVDMSSLELLPDSNLEECFKYLATPAEEKVELVFSQTAYYTPLPHMSKERTDVFKHPIAYTITQKNGLNFWYSSDNTRGQFGVPKVIVSKGAGCYPITDFEGDYGLTQFTYAITDKKENLLKIEKALKSEKFLKLMKDLGSGNDRYTREALSLLKKDFWKEFI